MACCLSLAVAAGCAGSRSAASRSTAPATLPRPAGPLAHARWPAGSVHAGDLLHDDGVRLWRVPLSGEPVVLWKHPKARVYEISAAPDGRALAYSVTADPPPPPKAPSSFLYLLRADGGVQTVDTIDHYGGIESPIFLRTPSEEHGAVRLYWIRSHESLQRGTEHLRKQVIVLDRGRPRAVRVDLRNNEAADRITGYAGSPVSALTTFRHDNLPTRLEVLRLERSPRPVLWSELGTAANTDDFAGVAWVSPREYVVPVNQLAHPETSVRLFRVGCEYDGSHVVHEGTDVDGGQWDVSWPMLPLGPAHVLVLGAAEVQRVALGQAATARWLRLDLRTGELERTDALWSRTGWWTTVQPASRVGFPSSKEDANCGKYTWSFP